MKKETLLLATLILGMGSAIPIKSMEKKKPVKNTSMGKKVGEAFLDWDEEGKIAFFVTRKGDIVSPTFMGLEYWKFTNYAPEEEKQIKELIVATTKMAERFAKENKLPTSKSDCPKDQKAGYQILRLYKNGYRYEGPNGNLKEEFIKETFIVFQEFKKLHQIQQDWKEKNSTSH